MQRTQTNARKRRKKQVSGSLNRVPQDRQTHANAIKCRQTRTNIKSEDYYEWETHPPKPPTQTKAQFAQTLSGQFVTFPFWISRNRQKEFAQTVCPNCLYLGGCFLGWVVCLWDYTPFYAPPFAAAQRKLPIIFAGICSDICPEFLMLFLAGGKSSAHVPISHRKTSQRAAGTVTLTQIWMNLTRRRKRHMNCALRLKSPHTCQKLLRFLLHFERQGPLKGGLSNGGVSRSGLFCPGIYPISPFFSYSAD